MSDLSNPRYQFLSGTYDLIISESLIHRVDMFPFPKFHENQISEEELGELADRLSGTIEYSSNLPDDIYSSITHVDGQANIVININHGPAVIWFLLGHEIGHLWLHPRLDLFDVVEFSDIKSRALIPEIKKNGENWDYIPYKVLEDEANYFSICTFVPLSKMVEWYRKGSLCTSFLSQWVLKCLMDSGKISKEHDDGSERTPSRRLVQRMRGIMRSFKLRLEINKLIFADSNEMPKWDDSFLEDNFVGRE